MRGLIPGPAPARQGTDVRVRLAEAEETLRAIRAGEVDAVLTADKQGIRLLALGGAEQAYRLLIESMNEGALTLTADKIILYANPCFATMVRCPLEQVMGSSFRRFLSAEDLIRLQTLLKQTGKSGAKIQVRLNAGNGSQMPVQISIRPTARRGITGPTIGMVVTDLTDALRTEELLRALARRVVQVQEEDRRRVALELHDGITQMLCALLFRSQALAESLSERDGPAKGEAEKLRDMAGKTAKEVERVAHNLRPSVLDQLGLEAAMRETSEEFSDRTGVSVKLVFPKTNVRLTAESELTLYRILQEALRNVEKHADARLVTVDLTQAAPFAKLTIKDDGLGFNPDQRQTRQNGKGGLGLVGMRERAAYVGGTLKLVSLRGAGTEIVVCIPMLPRALANN